MKPDDDPGQPPAANENRRRLFTSGLLGLTIKVLAAVLSLAMFAAIARVTSTEDFGSYGFAFSLATLLAVAGSFGQRMFVLKEGAVLHAAGDAEGLAATGLAGVVIVASGTLGFALVAKLCDMQGWIALGDGIWAAMAALALALALAEYCTHLFRSFRSVAFSLVPRDILWRGAVIAICALSALGSGLGAVSALLASALSLLVMIGAQYLWAAETRASLRLGILRRLRLGTSLRAARHLWGTSLIQTIGGPVLAPVLLGLVLTPADVGPFFAAMRIALVMDLFTMAASMVVAPVVARQIRTGELASLQKVLSQSVIGVSAATGVSLLAILVFGDQFLALMNPDFAAAKGALVILACGYLVSVMTGPVPTIMELSGLEALLFRRLLWSNGFAFAAFWPMIWLFGMEGAALCVAGLRVFIHVSLLMPLRARLGIDPSIGAALRRPGPRTP